MPDTGFFLLFYLLPLLVSAGASWMEARQQGAPMLAGMLFSVLPVINMVYAGGWLLLSVCRPLDTRLRRRLDRAV
ncbi:hypothetical protein [Caldimonas tepidiphila]|uniref:hypothetical protein n=1 Tax=Caldimonas tepidiphila TaxID=2315841 RepID=UPI000E5B597E|nr:hypothetical protein [Caldimonas tepidiphila]